MSERLMTVSKTLTDTYRLWPTPSPLSRRHTNRRKCSFFIFFSFCDNAVRLSSHSTAASGEGFILVIDRRQDRWTAVRATLLRIAVRDPPCVCFCRRTCLPLQSSPSAAEGGYCSETVIGASDPFLKKGTETVYQAAASVSSLFTRDVDVNFFSMFACLRTSHLFLSVTVLS